MPNHVTNIIKFDGKEKDIKELLETIQGYEKTYDGTLEEVPLDFNKVILMPPELMVESGSLGSAGMRFVEGDKSALDNIDNEERRKEAIALGTQYVENKKKHGYADWYDWAVNNWGTKWNAYDFNERDEFELEFNTAWAHPFPIIDKISTMFPDVKISVEYADEDLGYNLGVYTIQNGEILESEDIKEGSDDATRRACEIKGYSEGEDWEMCENEDGIPVFKFID
jgi:methionine synthase II (cobalamin-independent)